MDVSDGYRKARERFVELAEQVGLDVQSHDTGLKGPGTDQPIRLMTDVAVANADVCSHVLLITTGLHGVEGHLGSAVLFDTLDRWRERMPKCRCVLIHALNPYGYAFNRRFDESNVDLNRNFLEDDQQYCGSPPMYAELDHLLNPPCPPARWDAFVIKALGFVARHGMSKLQRAIAEGQYDFPRGLFFGGQRPGWANKFLRDLLPQLLSGANAVTHVDIHSGLGKWANLELLVDVSPTDSQRRWLSDDRRGGYRCSEEASSDYSARGTLGCWSARQELADDYLYMCAEFGTYPPIRVLNALRRENQAHHHTPEGSAEWLAEKKRLQEVFFPANRTWLDQVVQRAAALIDDAQGRVR
ncbi:MAG: M14 family metallopeptidase [Aureliella sp.]